MGRALSQRKRTLEEYLTEHFFNQSSKSLQAVKLGIVFVNGKLAKRAGIIIDEDKDKIEVVGGGKLFVSRGGYKLDEALTVFDIEVNNRICLDIGASTGGFTDCLIQAGAEKVYAIDTGYGQLDWGLRTNSKVVCVERMNVRYLLPERLYSEENTKASLAVIDVSFISAIKILPSIQSLLIGQDHSELIILIKPQFEAGKDQVGRGGIIRNPSIHFDVLNNFVLSAYRAGVNIKKIIHSPLLGAEGNLEFLGYGTWPKAGISLNPMLESWLKKIVERAYIHFNLL